MKSHSSPVHQIGNALTSLLFVFMLIPAVSKADPLDLATIPLANSPTISIQPNLLFIMDDSGSMAWDYMPDWADSGTDSLFRNASYNTVAYNPEIRYLPPAYFTASGLNVTTYPSQTGMTTATGASSASKPNWRQVKNNPYRSTSTSNIETTSAYYHIVPGEYCTRRDLKVCVAQSAPSATHPYPAPVRWCNSSTNANAATPAVNSCQASRLTGFTNLRAPTQRTAVIRIDNSNSCSTVTGLVVNGKQIMNAAISCNNTESTTASRIADAINACTYSVSGNCTIAGYSATTGSGGNANRITITGPTAFSGNPNTPTTSGGGMTTSIINGFTKNNVPGERLFVPITPGIDSYPLAGGVFKASGRTDCVASTCTYVEEMTNYANWWAYYRTREQTMKTAASLAFKDVGEDFRVGFMTTSTRSDYMLNFNTFNTPHKAAWYAALFNSPADRNTPLRGALSKAGRIYANETTAKRGVFSDPIEYECQQNFTLLTTDGFWNTGDETSTYAGGPLGLDGSNVGNQDSAAAGVPPPLREGSPARADTLADVAKYYFDNDLRTTGLGNCSGALGSSVCQSPAPSTANRKQNMVTMTLGMGVDGTLSYTADYKTATTGDFFDIRNGTKSWPDPINNTTAERIDDLWHAAVNGGGTYFSAQNPTDLINQLRDALASIEVKLGAGAAAATSTVNPIEGESGYAYVATYTTGYWTGNLEKRLISPSTGEISLTADACVEDVLPTASCSAPSFIEAEGTGYSCVTPDITEEEACAGGTWDAENSRCKVAVAASCNGSFKQNNLVSEFSDARTIYMKVGGALAPFSYGNLTAAQRTTFETTFLSANLTQWPNLLETLTSEQVAAASGANLVNYLRGQTGYEETSTDPIKRVFRKRQATLGDGVNSKPIFVGGPAFSYVDSGYEAFKNGPAKNRTKMVYLGANDGMLHAFNAVTLKEEWAYVPSMVIPNMWKLADTAYAGKHSFYVDGSPVVADMWDGSSWRTILVAGLNGGGRGYYALDITNPTSPSLLWEFDANDEPNLGYTFGEPIVTKKPNGTWVVLVTSGYNNIPDNDSFYALGTTKFKPNNPALFNTGDGKGRLFVLNAVTGEKISEINTDVGSISTPSGLGKIRAFQEDARRNNTSHYVYGGDLLGNLWRFDLVANSKLNLAQLSGANGAQPITTRPELAKINNKRVLFVGTGKYLEIADLTNTDQQTLYAIKDDNVETSLGNPRSNLVQQTIVADGSDTRRSGTNNGVDWTSGLGWYIDLPDSGERQNVASQLVLGTLLVPTTVPTASACQPAGYGWFNILDYKTGLAVKNETIVSRMSSSPIVGMNVFSAGGKLTGGYIGAGGEIPPPKVLPVSEQSGFTARRAIWRELIPEAP